jgi:hypothetical protein
MRKLLSFIFGFEIAALLIALLLFRTLSDRTMAGIIAGSTFVALGVVIFALGLKSREFRGTFTFCLGSIHLFLISLPMMGSRVLNLGADFQSVMVLGVVPAPVFHRLSEMLYIVLVIGTVIDRVRERRSRA